VLFASELFRRLWNARSSTKRSSAC
jgi:hypothetical protein